MRKVEVSLYDPEWEQIFQREATILTKIFADILIDIHHIGSTSVPSLAAKPIIDVLIVVTQIELVDSFNQQMEQAGYIAKGENGIEGRRYFHKGETVRTHHIHIYEQGNPHIKRHLAFRDYLRQHPEEAKAYGELKRALAKKYPLDIESYINGKDTFVKEMEKKALDWWEKYHQ